MNRRRAEPRRPEFMVTLGLSPPYVKDDIEQSYRQLALKTHPDHGGSIDEFRALQTAYEGALAYIAFRTDKRRWVAEHVEQYANVQRVSNRFEGFGAEVVFDELDWKRESYGDFADLASNIKQIRFHRRVDTGDLLLAMVEEKDYLKRLQSLDLSNSGMIDEFLPRLSHFPRVVALDLRNTMVGSGVRQLVTELTALDEIQLIGTRVGMFSRWLIRRQLDRRRRERPIATIPPNC